MIERELDVTTPEGKMKTFIYHPQHEGPHPVVLYLMDAPSIRPALKDMDTRLASAGYYVMLPYLFYRGGPFREFREFGKSDEDMHARRELMAGVTPTNMVSDAKALLAVADADSAAARGKIGAVGFCMSGGLVIALTRARPERVAAAASIHGAWLVRDTPDSPHLGLDADRLRRAARGRGRAGTGSDTPRRHTPPLTPRARAPPELDAGFAFEFDQSRTWGRTEPLPDPGYHFDQTPA